MTIVSIIITAYNIQNYINYCLESVINQTVKDIQIIIVNDGSTDNTMSIISDFKRKHNEFDIIVINKINEGPSSARRQGLEVADGKWIVFIDGDDWIHPYALELMLDIQKRDDSEMVYTSFYEVYDNRINTVSLCNYFDLEKNKINIIKNGNSTYWAKLWKKDILLLYATFPNMWHEDVADVPKMYTKISRISYLDKPLYYYNKTNVKSITKSVNYDLKRNDIFYAMDIMKENDNQKYHDEILYRLLKTIVRNTQYWEIYDKNIEYLHFLIDEYPETKSIINNMDKREKDIINNLRENYCDEKMEKNLYINDLYKYDESLKRTFFIINNILDLHIDTKENNDVLYNELLKNERQEDALYYRACIEIFKNGGLFIESSLSIVNSFDKLIFYPSVFVYDNGNHVSSLLFGGKKGNITFGKIIDYWNEVWLKDGILLTFNECVETVLLVFSNIHYNHQYLIGDKGEHVYNIEWLYYKYLFNAGHTKIKNFDNDIKENVEMYIMKIITNLNEKNAKCNTLDNEMNRLTSSYSFKIGRMITFIPRKISKILNGI